MTTSIMCAFVADSQMGSYFHDLLKIREGEAYLLELQHALVSWLLEFNKLLNVFYMPTMLKGKLLETTNWSNFVVGKCITNFNEYSSKSNLGNNQLLKLI